MPTRTETGINKVSGVRPDYLANYAEGDHSTDGMDEYRVLPRHKVVQGASDQVLQDLFGVGTVIIQPGNAKVWKREEPPFKFVPVLFFVEFCKWGDLKDKENVIVARSFDPTSDIAKKAKNADTRIEVYAGHEDKPPSEQWKYRYVQHFRFVGVIYDQEHPLNETPLTISFEKGEFFTGQNFISAIKMRKVAIEVDGKTQSIQVPLYAQVWNISASLRDRGDKKWWGLDVVHQEELVAPEHIEEMKAMHGDMKAMKEAERLVVDESPGITDEAAVAATDM